MVVDFDVVVTTLFIAVNDADAPSIAIAYITYETGTSVDIVFHVNIVVVVVVVDLVVAHANAPIVFAGNDDCVASTLVVGGASGVVYSVDHDVSATNLVAAANDVH